MELLYELLESLFRGWHSPLQAREVVTVLLVGAAGGAILWAISELLRAF